MDKLREAARQVVDAWGLGEFTTRMDEAITALREALDNPEERGTNRYEGWVEVAEQAEQEPVAWKDLTYGNLHHQDFGNSIPLYAAPVRTKDLTASEIRDIWNSSDTYDVFCVEFARAVIAADREKNK